MLRGMVPDDSAVLTHLRRGVLEYCILAMIDVEPLYGLDIARRLGAHDVLLQSEGTLYPLLARLRRQGLVETSQVKSATGPPRRYYALTAEGKTALETFRSTWPAFRSAVDSAMTGERS
ncbi:PadR family transcriptional regulator [Saccharopolyspora gloriosae]